MVNKSTYNLQDATAGDHKKIPSNSLVQINDYDGQGKIFFFTLKDSRDLEDFSTLTAWMVVYPDRWQPLGDGVVHNYDPSEPMLELTFPDLSPFEFTVLLQSGTPTLRLPLQGGYTYNMRVDWGDGTQDVINSGISPLRNHQYSSGGAYTIKIYGRCEAWSFFNNNSSRLDIKSVVSLGKVGWKNLHGAFTGCQSMISFNPGDTDLSQVQDFSSMFRDCYALSSYTQFDTSTATNLYATWRNCYQLPSDTFSTPLDVSNCTNFTDTWFNCSSITSFAPLNCPEGLHFNNTFYRTQMKTLDILTPKGQSFERTFEACTKLTCLKQMNTLSQTNTSFMFQNTPSLGNPNTSEQTDIMNGLNWVNGNNRPCPGTVPTFDDPSGTPFVATEGQIANIRVTFGNATGSDPVQYDLYSQSGGVDTLQISDIQSGHDWRTWGVYNLFVRAHNYAGFVDSNIDVGSSIEPELNLTLAQASQVIELDSVINNNNPENLHTVNITNNLTQPTIFSGDLTGLDVTLINNGNIHGIDTQWEALNITSPLTLINNGWIRGAGGWGGRGGQGGYLAAVGSFNASYLSSTNIWVHGRYTSLTFQLHGGGGSGSVYGYYWNNTANAKVGSGHRGKYTSFNTIPVTGNKNHHFSCGNGGAAVSMSMPTAGGTWVDGKIGGSSTFIGKYSGGGLGGKYLGQYRSPYYVTQNQITVYAGEIAEYCIDSTHCGHSGEGRVSTGGTGAANPNNATASAGTYSSGGGSAGMSGQYGTAKSGAGGKGGMKLYWPYVSSRNGGSGGGAGYGQSFLRNKTQNNGFSGSCIGVPGTWCSGKGGQGGPGGGWGLAGTVGSKGITSSDGTAGSNGQAGTASGESIKGNSFVKAGSVIGNTAGPIV